MIRLRPLRVCGATSLRAERCAAAGALSVDDGDFGDFFCELFRLGLRVLLESADGYLDVRDLGKTMKSKDHRMLSQSV